MHYITLDLEWNQAYQQKALAVQKRLECRLRGEVIQIGAVKLDEGMNIIGSYRITVRPRFFKNIQKHVARLTGIDQTMADNGVPLPEAIERFHRWCGEDFAFLTWGPDDIPMLEENLRAHRLELTWLSPSYDLQRIFNHQTDGGKTQRSLEYAMEYFALEQNLPAHDALNDAYFTALVAQKLDVKKGITTYEEKKSDEWFSCVLGDADGGSVGYATLNDLMRQPEVASPTCPLCGKALAPQDKWLHSKGQRYTQLVQCPEHGNMLLRLRVMRNFNETWRARCTLSPSTPEKEEDYRRRLKESSSSARRRRTRRRGHAKEEGDAEQ